MSRGLATGQPPHEQQCGGHLRALACKREHIAPQLRAGQGNDFLCPVPEHRDRHASLSLNPGERGVRMVWCCHGGCDPADVREALLNLGIDENCLGRYGTRRTDSGASHFVGTDRATLTDARRWHAAVKLPADLNGELRKMCIQAIAEWEGDPPSDPRRLLPADYEGFLALATRAGVERRYKYQLYRRWIEAA